MLLWMMFFVMFFAVLCDVFGVLGFVFCNVLGGGPKQTQANPKPTQIKPTPTQSKITPNQSQHKAHPSQPKANQNRTKANHKQPQSKPHPIQSPPRANLIQSKKHRTPTPNPDCQEHTPPIFFCPTGIEIHVVPHKFARFSLQHLEICRNSQHLLRKFSHLRLHSFLKGVSERHATKHMLVSTWLPIMHKT